MKIRSMLVATVAMLAVVGCKEQAGTDAAGKAGAVRLLITWPAAADQANAVTPTKFSGCFEVVAALDGN